MTLNKQTGLYEFNPTDKYWVTYKGSVRYTTVFMNDNYMSKSENGNYASNFAGGSWSLRGWGCDVRLNENQFSQDRKKFLKLHLRAMEYRIEVYNEVWLQPKVDKIITNFPELVI